MQEQLADGAKLCSRSMAAHKISLSSALCKALGASYLRAGHARRSSAPGGRKAAFASKGPWREISTPVRAMAATKEANGAPASASSLLLGSLDPCSAVGGLFFNNVDQESKEIQDQMGCSVADSASIACRHLYLYPTQVEAQLRATGGARVEAEYGRTWKPREAPRLRSVPSRAS